LELFGIFSPTLGLKQDFPTILLQESFTPEATNIRIVNGELHRASLRRSVLDDLAATPLALHWLSKTSGEGYLFAFTADNIYYWNATTGAWVEHVDAGVTLSTATRWSVITYKDKVIATNGVDKVLIGDDATAFDIMGSASGIEYETGLYLTKAAFVTTFENYVILCDTTENSVRYPRRRRWCAIGDYTDWITTAYGPGAADVGGAGRLNASGSAGGFLLLFKDSGEYHRVSLTNGQFVWEQTAMPHAVGCPAPDSVVNTTEGDLLFLASDKTIRTASGQVISAAVDGYLKGIPDAAISKVRARRIDEYGEIWWAIPYGPEVTANNLVLTLKDGRWGTLDIPVSAFGVYCQEAGGIAFQDITWTFAEWADPFNSVSGGAGFMMDLVGATGGGIYEAHSSQQDAGVDATASFVMSTDLTDGNSLGLFKRLLSMRVFARSEITGSTATIYVKRDTEPTWQTAGTVSLVADGAIAMPRLPCDYRARTFQIKVETTGPLRFLGMIFEYIPDGLA
jgi:hypothetical protein